MSDIKKHQSGLENFLLDLSDASSWGLNQQPCIHNKAWPAQCYVIILAGFKYCMFVAVLFQIDIVKLGRFHSTCMHVRKYQAL